jgi:hypothetical protein
VFLRAASASWGHILEEMKEPMAYEVTRSAEQEATAHLRTRRLKRLRA